MLLSSNDIPPFRATRVLKKTQSKLSQKKYDMAVWVGAVPLQRRRDAAQVGSPISEPGVATRVRKLEGRRRVPLSVGDSGVP